MKNFHSALEKEVARFLPEPLLDHSLRVASYARELAMIHGLNSQKAYLAGLLHDVGKALSHTEQLDLIRKRHLKADLHELAEPGLLHAVISTHLARERFGMKDRSVLSAIRKHTTGDVRMSEFDKLMFLADSLEPGRIFNGAEKYRAILTKSVTEAFEEFYVFSHKHLVASGKNIHPVTIKIITKIKGG